MEICMENEEFLKKLGQKIRVLRKNRRISQEKLAAELKCDQGYLSRIETGKANPSAVYLKQIAESLNLDIRELFNFTI